MKLFNRVKNILLTPLKELSAIKTETTTVKSLLFEYAVPLASIPAIAGFIGFSLFGISWGFSSYSLTVGFTLKWLIITYVLNLVSVFVIAYIIDTLAPYFGSSKDFVSSMKVVVYAYTASWVGGILNLFPVLSFIVAIAGIYSLYLMYLAMKTILPIPQDKLVSYFITVIIISIVIYALTSWIVTSLTFNSLFNIY
jgi:hypothetical protein